MPPLKPEVAVIDGKLALFIGADYKLLPLEKADALMRKIQGAVAAMKREQKRAKRKGRVG